MTMLEFHNILGPMAKKGSIAKFSFYGMHPVVSSHHLAIHSLGSEINQHARSADDKPDWADFDFTVPVFKELLVTIDLDGKATPMLESILKPTAKLFTSHIDC